MRFGCISIISSFFAKAVWASDATLAALASSVAWWVSSLAALILIIAALASLVAFFARAVCSTDAFLAAFASFVAFLQVLVVR